MTPVLGCNRPGAFLRKCKNHANQDASKHWGQGKKKKVIYSDPKYFAPNISPTLVKCPG